MQRKAKNPSVRLPLVESLESRQLLSTAANIHLSLSGNPSDIGNTETFTVTVSDPNTGSGLTPSGSVKFKDGSTLLEKVTLTNGVAAFSTDNLFTGTHVITAKYMGDANFSAEVSNTKNLNVIKGAVQTFSDGVQIETFGSGTGPAAATGDAVEVNYAGFVAATGVNFQTSAPGMPLSDTVGGFVPGFNEGLVGLQQGETRVIYIPAAQGYGANPQSGSGIPPNARLVFIISLASAPAPQVLELGVTGANSQTITSNEAPSTSDGTQFENVSVSSSSGPLTITLSSANGASGLEFTKNPGIVVAGTDPADFIASQDTSGTFTVTFSPMATGLRTAKIKIFTNDTTTPIFIINVQGTGL